MTQSASLLLPLERASRRALFKVCRQAVRTLSYRQIHVIGAVSGELQFRIAQIFQRRMLNHVARVLEGARGERSITDILRSAFRVNNAGMLEILKILEARQDVPALLSQVEIVGVSTLQAALSAGNGAILLGTHMGNSALFLIRLAQSGIPLSIVHREAPMMEPGFFGQGIARYGIEPILANRGAHAYRSILSALRANRAVYMCIDQGVKKATEGVSVRFLGKDMPMPAGPAHLVRQSNAKVLPVAAVTAEPKWQLEILPPLELRAGADIATDLKAMLQMSEQTVLRSPHLWSWHQRRWRNFPLAGETAARE